MFSPQLEKSVLLDIIRTPGDLSGLYIHEDDIKRLLFEKKARDIKLLEEAKLAEKERLDKIAKLAEEARIIEEAKIADEKKAHAKMMYEMKKQMRLEKQKLRNINMQTQRDIKVEKMSSQNGGIYYDKYLKYKIKYLQLRKQLQLYNVTLQ